METVILERPSRLMNIKKASPIEPAAALSRPRRRRMRCHRWGLIRSSLVAGSATGTYAPRWICRHGPLSRQLASPCPLVGAAHAVVSPCRGDLRHHVPSSWWIRIVVASRRRRGPSSKQPALQRGWGGEERGAAASSEGRGGRGVEL